MAELNEILEEKLKVFTGKLSEASENDRKLFHHNSVLNLSGRIVHYNSLKARKSKEKLITYFDELEKMEYTLQGDKILSSKLYNKYLLNVTLFLFDEEKFISDTDLSFLMIIGLILDFLLYYFIWDYLYPVFLICFTAFGIYRRKKAKKENKYSAMFW